MTEQENILNLLKYLFTTSPSANDDTTDKLSKKLKTLGIPPKMINKVTHWLSNFLDLTDRILTPANDGAFRIFAADEQLCMNTECQNYLLSLESQQILTPYSRELVINRLLDIQSNINNTMISIELIQWVCLIVLYHLDDAHNDALSHMKRIVLTEEHPIH